MPASPWDNLNPVFSTRVQQMIAASGGLLAPGSGYRTIQQQAKLRRLEGRQARPGPAAAPGRSNHNHGLAMDLVDTRTGGAVQAGSAADRWLKANAARFGLHQAVKGEAWHVELIDDDEAGAAIRGAVAVGALAPGSRSSPSRPRTRCTTVSAR